MSSQIDGGEEAAPDPTLLRLQKRLRRLMLIGGLTLGLGVAAVLFAIIYRFFIADTTIETGASSSAIVSEIPGPSPANAIIGEITAEAVGLDVDAELVSVALDGTQMALAFRDGPDLVTVLVDTTTMVVIGQFRVTAE